MAREKKEKQQSTSDKPMLSGNDTEVVGEITTVKPDPELDRIKFQPDTRVGAITNKVQLHSKIQCFQSSLAAISLVHRRGARKYPPYGWFHDPFHTDATPTATLSALLRHFTAHSMGFFTDIEGLPHIFHMCCRAAMYVSIKYKWRFGAVLRWNHELLTPSSINFDTEETSTFSQQNWGVWITPMVLVSLSKFTPELYNYCWNDGLTMTVYTDSNQFSYEKLKTVTWETYIQEASTSDDQSETIVPLTANQVFQTIYPEDVLFCLTLLLCEKWLSMVNLPKLILPDTLTDKDKELLTLIIKSADEKSIL